MEPRAVRIRIVALPPGEAPQWVREAWIGLELPTEAERGVYRAIGVSSGLSFLDQLWRSIAGKGEMIDGYVVEARRAVEILAAANPAAAAWWRQNTPQLLAQNRRFIFNKDVCEVVA